MSALLSLVSTNAATAAALALLAWAAGRAIRRPAVVHGLWLLALAKLVTPPVLPMAVLPAWSAAAGEAAGPVAVPIPPPAERSALAPRDAAPVAQLDLSPARPPAPVHAASGRRTGVAHGAPLTPPAPARGGDPASRLPSPGALLAALLGLGSLFVTAVAWLRARRFGALLDSSSPAPDALATRADELARRLGLRGAPPVRLTPGAVPPMLWPTRRGPLLVLPARLLTELSDDERDALLAHELAHVRRRDHWVRFVELAATALFWWYPVAWWARRALRRAEERCCDEWVLRVLPSSAGAYANGLLKSVAFVAGEPLALPAAASGAGPVEDLEARLKEILMTRPMPRLAAPVRLALGVAAAAGLAVFPTQAASRTADASGAFTATTLAAQPAPAPAAAPRPAPELAPRPARAVAGVARATAPPRPAAVGGVTGGLTGGALGGTSGGVLAAGTPLPDLAAPADDEDPALASERRAIEEQRRALRAQEIELERRTLALEAKANEQRLAGEAARLRADGRDRDAQRVEKEVRLERRHLELQEQQLRLEVESARIEARVEKAGADEAAVAEVEAARDALEKKQRALEADMEAMAREVAAADAEARVDALHESTGELERSIAEHIESLRQALPEAGSRQPEIEHEMQRLQSALDALGARPGATRMKVRTTAPPERMRQPAPEPPPATAPRR